MRQVETFLDGAALFAHSTEFDLEGVISKRIDQPYVTGPAKYCVKSKSRRGGVTTSSASACSRATRRSQRSPRSRRR